MIPILVSRLSLWLACRRACTRLLLPIALSTFACASVSCTDQGPPIVDTTPLGDGLKVIGYAIIGAAVLAVLGKLVK